MAKKRTTTRAKKKNLVDEGARGGFTIIEVVLVLAIAGLIFLMVFIALPTLQRSQRDTQRRTQLGLLVGQLQQYQTNNNGRLPDNGETQYEQDNENMTVDQLGCGKGVTTKEKPAQCFVRRYINSSAVDDGALNEFVDPDGTPYNLTITDKKDGGDATAMSSQFSDHRVFIVKGARCDGEEIVTDGANARDFAIYYKLEGNGTYCRSNAS